MSEQSNDQPPSSWSENQAIIYELHATYQAVTVRMTTFIQEVPADLLLQADQIEQDPPAGMSDEEVGAYANGIRYAAQLVAISIVAHMEADKAETHGELGEIPNADG